DNGRKLLQEGDQILEVLCFEIDDDMPAELRDPLGDAKEYFLGCRIDEAFYEIETHGANARRIHLFELVVADILPHDGNAARKAARRFQRIDQRIVILAVAGGLHDDVAGEAEIVAQPEQLLLRRIAGRVFPLRRVREEMRRAENMAMRIDRA